MTRRGEYLCHLKSCGFPKVKAGRAWLTLGGRCWTSMSGSRISFRPRITISATGMERSPLPHPSRQLRGRAVALDWWSSRRSACDCYESSREEAQGMRGFASARAVHGRGEAVLDRRRCEGGYRSRPHPATHHPISAISQPVGLNSGSERLVDVLDKTPAIGSSGSREAPATGSKNGRHPTWCLPTH